MRTAGVKKVDGHYEIDGEAYKCECDGVFRLTDDPDGFGGKDWLYVGSTLGRTEKTAVAQTHECYINS